MPKSDNPAPDIQIGDSVVYRLTTRDPVNCVQGKVLGIFNTNDGQKLADVEWDALGPPGRIKLERLIKA